MSFQSDVNLIRWRLHLNSPPEAVYEALATDAGRAGFWAESAVEQGGMIRFIFPNHAVWEARILEMLPPARFALIYYGGLVVTFYLEVDGRGGTDLTLIDRGVPVEDRAEVAAGWVSVLMALKGAVDFGVDLRSHDPQRHWDTGYCDN